MEHPAGHTAYHFMNDFCSNQLHYQLVQLPNRTANKTQKIAPKCTVLQGRLKIRVMKSRSSFSLQLFAPLILIEHVGAFKAGGVKAEPENTLARNRREILQPPDRNVVRLPQYFTRSGAPTGAGKNSRSQF